MVPADPDPSAVCRRCRLCADLCPVFPILLGGEPSAGAPWEDLCYDCGLCRAQCPYAPGSGADPEVDVPRFVLWRRAQRVEAGRGPWGGRPRANPDLLAAAGSLLAPVLNRIGPTRAGRRLLEETIGFPREAPLPRFQRRPFDRWFRKIEKRLAKRTQGTGGGVVLFPGCTANVHDPGGLRSTVEVLAALDVRLAVPDERCCGLHALEAGAIETARENVRANTRVLHRHVARGETVVAYRAECAGMLREEAPRIVPDSATREVAGAVRRIDEVLERLHREDRFDGRFRHPPGRLLVHVGCRQTALGGDGAAGLLEGVPGARVERLERCCAGNALWRGDATAAEASRGQRARFLETVRSSGTERFVTDCFYAAELVRAHCRIPVSHPVEIVREAMDPPPVR
ncbi:MAG: hypothetical protein GF346_09335 [Candidatus Eisenbacteria bacterium]|nr:hypothetical protein [Candidatus Latescibacterota bacterium]MBD3302634.1 hypothetical protein [Candidatus Eisenbacteria bacterium]